MGGVSDLSKHLELGENPAGSACVTRSDKDGGSERKSERGQERKQVNDDEDGSENANHDEGKDGKTKKKSRLPVIVLVIFIALSVIGGVIYWLMTRDFESTDDAYTEGNAVSIAPKVSGYVVERRVDDNNFVRQGELMLRIDPRDYVTARDQARANLELAQAQLRSAEIDLTSHACDTRATGNSRRRSWRRHARTRRMPAGNTAGSTAWTSVPPRRRRWIRRQRNTSPPRQPSGKCRPNCRSPRWCRKT